MRPTDHATRSVRIGDIYVRSTAMQTNNDIHNCTAPYSDNLEALGPGSVLVRVRRGKRVGLREEECL